MLQESLFRKNFLAEPSLWLLLISNCVTIFFALVEGWGLSTVLWVYWFQSVTIGVFNFVRIMQLKEFSTEGFKINGRSVEPTEGTKRSTAFFFLLHYGLFHFVYAIFLFTGKFGGALEERIIFDSKTIFIAAGIFFVNHLFSFIYNKPRDTKKQNIGTLMFYPYARILPMHLIIMFGFIFGGGAILFFLIIKTIADMIMHGIEHHMRRSGAVT